MSGDEKEVKKKPVAAPKGKAGKISRNEENLTPVEGIYPRLRTKFKTEIRPQMLQEFKFKSVMQAPELKKIVINAGLGSRATQNIKVIDQAVKDLTAITGQKPVTTKSKVAISNFKLRAGLPIGVMITLRGNRMYEFLDRLLSLALPRIRDFRGISEKGFDGHGNYTLGLKEQLVFPEVTYDTIDSSFGMNISFITTASNDDEGRALMNKFGFPFRKRAQTQKTAA